MRIYCIAQETLFNALWWLKWEGNPTKGIYVYIQLICFADDTTLMAESEELKSLLMEMKEESEKLAQSSTFRKLRSWYPVPSLHGK